MGIGTGLLEFTSLMEEEKTYETPSFNTHRNGCIAPQLKKHSDINVAEISDVTSLW